MPSFIHSLQHNLQTLSLFSHLEISLSHPLFTTKKGKVATYIQEISQTGELLSKQNNSDYATFYAQKLVQQFALLQKTIQQHDKPKVQTTVFKGSYRFPKNIHNLPVDRRLQEYRKALRLLNEKLTWLMEQAQSADENQRQIFISQIQETEYRKLKCSQAIDELESSKKS